MKTSRSLAALFSLSFVALFARGASAETYKVDPVHSFVIFAIHHLNAGYVYGRFNEPTGAFTLDEQDPAKDSFTVTAEVKNLDTANAMRDKDLRGPDWFNAKQFATIVFKSSSVKKSGDKALEVTGEVTLHGVTKPLTVTIQLTGTGKGMKGETRGGIESMFVIKRSDFGMQALAGAVGDEVRLTVALEGVQE